MQIKKQQLELDMEQQTGSKQGTEYLKGVYCHCAYLTYMQSTPWETAGDQPRLIQGIRRRDGIGEDQDTIASIRY